MIKRFLNFLKGKFCTCQEVNRPLCTNPECVCNKASELIELTSEVVEPNAPEEEKPTHVEKKKPKRKYNRKKKEVKE